ncbi:hypothetical protein L1887_12942 [Cichorium endivia]|nr:hypothetical protein L1887_12942 [Cichorium endivia]
MWGIFLGVAHRQGSGPPAKCRPGELRVTLITINYKYICWVVVTCNEDGLQTRIPFPLDPRLVIQLQCEIVDEI